MGKFEVGDLVKGLPGSNKYGITDENMTKGVVREVTAGGIIVRVLEHKLGYSGKFEVDPEVFEKIGHLEPFDREKFLELLKESKAKAAEYLSGADLSGADLSGANLSGANLRRADLSDADLSGANLSGADLSDADLSGANLSGADLSDADLRRADLSGANLSGANLRRADLSDADLSGANLSGADLSDADLSGANLSGADLSDADLRRANLSGADLSDADLSDADLSGANLSGADLSDADLSDADLSDADLSGANLSGADLSDADLSDADLRRANLRRADLRRADLSGSQGLLDAINYMEAHFERTDEGYIVYKSFNENYSAPESWKIELGEIIEETVNCDRTIECGCGINVAPLEWVRRNGCNQPYKLLIRWEWLPGVVVPYNTDGKIRCSKARILEAVE